ncbi:MAG: restriction endonuclease subunit S [Alistipes sp.]
MTTELSQVITDIAAGPFGSNLKVECFVPSGFPIIDGANLKGFKVTDNITKFVTEEKAQSLHRSIAHRGDVVVTISGTIGQIAYIPEDSEYEAYLVSQRQFRVTFDDTQVFVPYLVYYFHTAQGQHQILSFANQTGVPALSQPLKNFKKITIDLPPLEEQRRIAGILGSLDDKIELNRRINANLEAQAQALFRSWFVDFEPFRDGPFVDSELGKIPQGWKVETLSNLATVIKKGITPSNSETYSHYSIPAYDDAHFPEKQSGETIKSGKYIVYNNSILLSKLNPRIKRLWFIKTAEENAICSTEFIPIQTKDTELISFVFYLIDSDIFYQQALSLVNGATGSHQRFHAEDIMQIPFAWNKDAAIDFAQKANYILQKIEDNIRENQTLSALRDTMLPKLMAGEIAIE